MTSILHDVYHAGGGSEHYGDVEERMDRLRDDPVLSALLRRFGEIEAEIERRHSAKLKWRKPNDNLGE